MALDSRGYLHMVYGPHGRPMSYRRSAGPYQFASFTAEEKFGEHLTGPSIFIGADDVVFVAARESTGIRPDRGSLELYARRPGDRFRLVSRPLISRIPGYTSFNPSLFIETGGRMHLTARVHEGTYPHLAYGRVQGACYLYSDDLGRSWHSSRGSVRTPAMLPHADVLYLGGLKLGTVVNGGTVVVDPKGVTRTLVSVEDINSNETNCYLASRHSGDWILEDLQPKFQNFPSGYGMANSAGAIIVALPDGKLRILFQAQKLCEGDRDPINGVAWAHPTTTTFTAEFSPGDSAIPLSEVADHPDGAARWLATLERPTLLGRAVHPTVALYTRGTDAGGYVGGESEVWATYL